VSCLWPYFKIILYNLLCSTASVSSPTSLLPPNPTLNPKPELLSLSLSLSLSVKRACQSERKSLFLFSLKLSFSHSLEKFLSLLPWRWQSYHLPTPRPTCTQPSSHSCRPVSPITAAALFDRSLEHEALPPSLALLHQSKLLINTHQFFPDTIVYSHGFVLLVILSQVQAPAAVEAEDPKNKPECYGVFCLTYDLKAVSFYPQNSRLFMPTQ
jgi:hypothetical protein